MQLVSRQDLARVEALVRVLEIVIILFKLLPVIVGVLAGISLLLAVLNVLEANYVWAVVNGALGVGGVMFLIKLNRRSAKHFEYPHDADVN
ncbi:hypothetical protein [Candidatus Nitrososphaera sp. FF02]|uniref:hypothetical protein n=1 Tax=Candidatus Nitrososphaera sp. FF02 TaxID=3398226 RepID=UPI0039E73AA4